MNFWQFANDSPFAAFGIVGVIVWGISYSIYWLAYGLRNPRQKSLPPQ